MEMNICVIKKIVIVILLLTLVNAVQLAASQTVAPAGIKPRRGGTFVYALTSDPGNLNPATTTSFNTGQAAGPCYEGLTYDSRESGFPPKPALATSWESSDDVKTWTFNLRENVTFHDGTPFTSADVKFTVEEVLVPYHPGGKTIWKNLASIATPDNYTVVFNFDQGIAPLPFYVSDMWCSILPKHLWEDTDILTNEHTQNPVGTGPFKFKEYKKGEYVSYERYEDYWGGEPYLDGVIARVIPDETMRGIAFEAGEISFMSCFVASYPDAVRLSGRPGVYISTNLWNEQVMNYMIVDMGDPQSPTSNKLVRQALSYAIDKEEFTQLTTFGFDKAATSVFQSVSWAYNEDIADVKGYPFNTTKAEELLDQAGYPRGQDGIRMTLKLRSWSEDLGRKKADITADMLAEVGIKCDIHILEYVAHKDAVYVQGDYDIAYTVGYTTGPDPMIAGRFFHSGDIHDPPIAYTNTAKYNNSRIDEIFNQALTTSDIDARKELYYEAQVILMEDLPFIPITEANFPQICSTDFIDIPSSGKGPRSGLENVWWAYGEPIEATEMELKVGALEETVDDLTAQLGTMSTISYVAVAVAAVAIIISAVTLIRKPK